MDDQTALLNSVAHLLDALARLISETQPVSGLLLIAAPGLPGFARRSTAGGFAGVAIGFIGIATLNFSGLGFLIWLVGFFVAGRIGRREERRRIEERRHLELVQAIREGAHQAHRESSQAPDRDRRNDEHGNELKGTPVAEGTHLGYDYVHFSDGTGALKLSSGKWRKFPTLDELKTYVDAITGHVSR
jgi:hypothetical protein